MKYQLYEIDGAELVPIKKSDKLINGLFFNNLDEMCRPLSYHINEMVHEGVDELTLNLAEREIGSAFFYCRLYHFVGEKSEGGCGRECNAYAPRNGKSGACKHSGYTYDNAGRQFLLRIENK